MFIQRDPKSDRIGNMIRAGKICIPMVVRARRLARKLLVAAAVWTTVLSACVAAAQDPPKTATRPTWTAQATAPGSTQGQTPPGAGETGRRGAQGTAPAKRPTKPASLAPGATILLATKLVAGQRATLAVLDAAGRLMPGAVVEFTGGERVTTDQTGRAAFTAPVEPGVLLARLVDHIANASTTVIAPAPNLPDGVQVLDYPRVISVSDRFVIDGFGFRGDADANRILLGDRPALVMAASPTALVVMPGPDAEEGPAQLVVEVGGRSPGPVPVTLVSLRVMAPKKELLPGEKGKLIVRVRGTDQRLVIEARNLSPRVVGLSKGNVQRVASSGGEANFAEIDMHGLRAGDFSVSVRLVPVAVGLPDVEAARQRLLAARRLATGNWQERLDRLLRRLERDPQDALQLRNELEKMLAEKPEGEFGRMIEAAWRELLKH